MSVSPTSPGFRNLSDADEETLLAEIRHYRQARYDAGYGAITWPVEYGGAGLPAVYEDAFNEEEAAFVTPTQHETFSVTVRLVAPTINLLGTERLRERFVRRFVRADDLCCQLFSEPGAGSDLASLGVRAVRDGDEWVINGQKVWSSGARFSAWGELIARSDPDVPKHAGLTAFIIPMDSPGLGGPPHPADGGGSSFNEVFFTDVGVPDELRLGDSGRAGRWRLTTLGFERGGRRHGAVGGTLAPGRQLARRLGRTGDPVVRQRAGRPLHQQAITQLIDDAGARSAASGQPPGPKRSIGKLRWSQDLTLTGEVVSVSARPSTRRRHGRVGHVRMDRARARRARIPHRRWHRRDPAQHHRRAGPRPAARAAGRQGHPVLPAQPHLRPSSADLPV